MTLWSMRKFLRKGELTVPYIQIVYLFQSNYKRFLLIFGKNSPLAILRMADGCRTYIFHAKLFALNVQASASTIAQTI